MRKIAYNLMVTAIMAVAIALICAVLWLLPIQAIAKFMLDQWPGVIAGVVLSHLAMIVKKKFLDDKEDDF